MELYLDSEDVRYILQNAAKIKRDGKCLHCNGTGWVNWNGETGDDLKPGRATSSKREDDECETCDGVGYSW